MNDNDEDTTDISMERVGDTANAVVEFLVQKKLSMCDIILVLIMAHVTIWKNTSNRASEAKELTAYVETFKKVSAFVDEFCSFQYKEIKPTQQSVPQQGDALMAVNTQPITDASDELSSSLTEGAQAVDALAQGIVDALNALDERLTAVEEGGGSTVPPIEPPPEGETGTIPLTWNDASFSDNAQSGATTIGGGQTIAKKSITETGHTASIISQGGTIDTCRVNSREGVRVASSGTHTIKDSYLEATGTGDDHADTIQAYAPGSKGKIVVTNSTIRAHNTAATAGFFIADNWTGTVEFTDVVFQGGPYGCRVHPDTGGDNILKFRNVFFVGPFGYAPFLFSNYGGHKNVFEVWENVRHATIVNGELVPGNIINKPASTETSAESMTKEKAVKETKAKTEG